VAVGSRVGKQTAGEPGYMRPPFNKRSDLFIRTPLQAPYPSCVRLYVAIWSPQTARAIIESPSPRDRRNLVLQHQALSEYPEVVFFCKPHQKAENFSPQFIETGNPLVQQFGSHLC
jgi:hypothetical protein